MSTDELFPIEAVLKDSPRIIWLREHNLETVQLREPDGLSESPETGEDIPVWVCRVKEPEDGDSWRKHEIAGGDTENDAICAFCEVSGITHWSGTP